MKPITFALATASLLIASSTAAQSTAAQAAKPAPANPSADPAPTEPAGIERFIAIDHRCAWPNLTLLPSGGITATIFGQPSHGQVGGQIEVWGSADGTQWQQLGHPAPNDPDTNRMNVAAGLDRDGKPIVLCSGWSNSKHPARPKQADYRDDILAPWVCRGTADAGAWTQLKQFPAPDAGWSNYVPFGDIIVGADGALHVSCYGGEYADPSVSTKTKAHRSWHLRSDDNGQSWTRTSIIGPTHNETTLLHLGGTRWLAAARERAMDVFWSEDDGLTWSAPQRVTATNEINGDLTRLKDGRVLLTYGSRVKDHCGVLARLSSDEGHTWGTPMRLAHSVASDCGYPSTIQRADGKLVTAYYSKAARDHARYHMGVALWAAPAP